MGKKEFVKTFTMRVPQREWNRIKKMSEEKDLNYTQVILDAVNSVFESYQEKVEVS